VRGFVFGIVLLALLTTSILSLRPGGIRRQLRFAARRLRIVLALGAIYVAGSTIIRVAFPSGPASDYGPPAIALVLFGVFMFFGRDPASADRQEARPKT
jgi:hypothetical protein